MVTSIPFLIARKTDDSDFQRLKELAINHESWKLAYDKRELKIWSKSIPDAAIKMIKVWAYFAGISSAELYGTLLDPLYRKEWDNHVIIDYVIGYLNHNNSVSYYAVSCPPPLKNRDFVLQSSWLDKKSEQFLLNHSVCHKDHPPRHGFIRAISYFTGYYLKNLVNNGCEMTFVSQTDFQGFIPAWLVNKCTQILAPKLVKQVERAASSYTEWKSRNNPTFLPWVHNEQRKAPQITVEDCVPSEEEKYSNFYKYLLQKTMKISASKPNHEDTVPGPVQSPLKLSKTGEEPPALTAHPVDTMDTPKSKRIKDFKKKVKKI